MAQNTCNDCGKKIANTKALRCRSCYQESRAGRLCEMPDCNKTYFANGMCRWHFNRSTRTVAFVKPCEACGTVITEVGRRKYCSDTCLEQVSKSIRCEWRRDRPEYRKRQSDRQRLRRHGIDPDTFVEPNMCEICGAEGETLAIDHDHSCCPGKYSCGECVRGFICNNCNNGLGRFMDDATLLQAAIDYLAKTNPCTPSSR